MRKKLAQYTVPCYAYLIAHPWITASELAEGVGYHGASPETFITGMTYLIPICEDDNGLLAINEELLWHEIILLHTFLHRSNDSLIGSAGREACRKGAITSEYLSRLDCDPRRQLELWEAIEE